MKHSFKKLLAAVMCVVMMFTMVSVVTSAASYSNPVFSVTVLSETNSKVTVSLNLVSGKFNCADFQFVATNGYTLASIEKGAALTQYDNNSNNSPSWGQSYVATGKVSIAFMQLYSATGSFYVATYNKSSSATSKNGDFSVIFSNCSVVEKGNTIPLAPSVKFGATTLSLSAANLEMNYKDSANITYTTNASSDCKVEWSSSNEDVVAVDENGSVYAAGKGDATITCTVTDASGKEVASQTCDVTVNYTFGQWLIIILLFGWIWYI